MEVLQIQTFECCVLLVLWFSDFSLCTNGKTLAKVFWLSFRTWEKQYVLNCPESQNQVTKKILFFFFFLVLANGLFDSSHFREGSRRALRGHFTACLPFLLVAPEDFRCATQGWYMWLKSVPPNGFDALLMLALDRLSTFCPISKASSFDDKVTLAVTSYLFGREAFLGRASRS